MEKCPATNPSPCHTQARPESNPHPCNPHPTFTQNCVAFSFTDGFFDSSPIDHRDGRGTPPHSPVARNRITMTIMYIVILTYLAYLVHTMVVLAVPIVVFSPALVVPFLVMPLLVRNTPLLAIKTTTGLLLKLSAKLTRRKG